MVAAPITIKPVSVLTFPAIQLFAPIVTAPAFSVVRFAFKVTPAPSVTAPSTTSERSEVAPPELTRTPAPNVTAPLNVMSTGLIDPTVIVSPAASETTPHVYEEVLEALKLQPAGRSPDGEKM